MKTKTTIVMCLACATFALVSCDQSGAPNFGTPPNPPAGAVFVAAESTPDSVITEVTVSRSIDDHKVAAKAFSGQWVGPPGWLGSVDKIHEGNGKTTLWLHYTRGGNLLRVASFLVAVELPVNDRMPKRSEQITFTGRIDEIRILEAGPIPEYQIIIRDGRVLTVNGK
jgi:hypothetical protein